VFLVQEHKLSLADAAWYAWAPPLAFPVGGLLGGWLSWRWIRAGADALSARYRVCVVSAIALLVTALAPFAGTPLVATLVISLSCAWSSAYSVNLYSMPLDAFGAARAAFGISLLTSAYGAMQAVASPVFGEMIDRWGFEPVCVLCAVLPLAGAAVLKLTRS
jgi:ACS family hexuronate transporter-like MFS transporter